MTTIIFDRSGGLVGNEIHLDLDLNSLPENESQYLHKLLYDAEFFNIPENLMAKSTPDEFQYVISVEAGNSSHTVRTCDTTMPKALAPLVKELTAIRVTQ